MKLPYSLVIITLNAADHLETCIRSVPQADEIIVVDSGSRDGTQALARQLGAKVIHQDWLGFGPQKKFAADQASHPWVLCLDADEALSETLRKSIAGIFQQKCRARCYCMARCNRFMGRYLKHGEAYPDYKTRLFHRDYAAWSDDLVHEKVQSKFSAVRLKGNLLHHSADNLGRYLQKQNHYSSLQAEILYRQGAKPRFANIVVKPLVRFVGVYFFRLGFLDGLPGLIHTAIDAFNSFLKYVKLGRYLRRWPKI